MPTSEITENGKLMLAKMAKLSGGSQKVKWRAGEDSNPRPPDS